MNKMENKKYDPIERALDELDASRKSFSIEGVPMKKRMDANDIDELTGYFPRDAPTGMVGEYLR